MSSLFSISLFSSFLPIFLFFFFSDPPPPEIYTLSLHDALPISDAGGLISYGHHRADAYRHLCRQNSRSEEHTSELQSPMYLVCRLLLEKKKKKKMLKSCYKCIKNTQYQKNQKDTTFQQLH